MVRKESLVQNKHMGQFCSGLEASTQPPKNA